MTAKSTRSSAPSTALSIASRAASRSLLVGRIRQTLVAVGRHARADVRCRDRPTSILLFVGFDRQATVAFRDEPPRRPAPPDSLSLA